MKGNEFEKLNGLTTYIGVKVSGAKPMTRAQYNTFRGWHLPKDEDGADAGYIVQYEDGYISWSPEKQFVDAYRKTSGMTFGLSVEAMKRAFKVQREGWNGKGMFLFLVTQGSWGFETDVRGVDDFGTAPFIAMKTVDGKIVPWLASQTDMLADDWQIVY